MALYQLLIELPIIGLNYIDLKVLGKHMWKLDYDPEGLVSTLPSIVTCVSGVLIGKILDNQNQIKYLLLSATSLLAFGYLWGVYFQINKLILIISCCKLNKN